MTFVDEDGYPTEEALDRLRRWEGTALELVEFVTALWWPQDKPYPGTNPYSTLEYRLDQGEPKFWHWELHTVGWSGNEEIITELQKTFFWFVCWQASRRGGHYEFRINEPYGHLAQWWGHLRGLNVGEREGLDDAPLNDAIALLASTERYSVKDNQTGDWIG